MPKGSPPVQVTFEGRNFDALVGLAAPAVAAGIASGRIGPRLAIAWNLSGLALLVNAIGTVATSAPGPLHRDWPGEPFVAIAAWPVVWIPAPLAPTGIFLHVVSLRQAIASPERLGADPAWSPMRSERIAGRLPQSLQVAGREILPKSFDQGTLRTTRSRRLNLPQIIPCASAEGPPCSGCASA